MNEDLVAEALDDLYRATTATVVAPDVGLLVGRARRRKTSRAVVAGIATVAVMVVAVAVGHPYLNRAPAPPATEPATEGRVDPLAVYPTKLSYGLILNYGALPRRPAPGGWSYSSAGASVRLSGFAYADCLGAPDEQLVVDFDGGTSVSYTLSLYPDEGAAAAAYATVAADLRRCLGFAGAPVVPDEQPTVSAGSVAVTFDMPLEVAAGQMYPASSLPARALAYRVGPVIGIVLSAPRNTSTTPNQAVSMGVLAAIASDVVPALCLYTEGGCPLQPGLPRQLTPLVRGGEAWLVVLDIFDTTSGPRADHWFPDPGYDVPDMARLGYRASIVRQGCDVGANIAEPGKEATTRYLALYYATEQEAQAVVDTIRGGVGPYENPLPRAPLKVRTWC